MKTKKYSLYKKSNIPWINKIPQEWEIHKIKDYLKFTIGGTPSTSNEEYFEGENIWVTIADLNNKKVLNDSKVKITNEAIINSNVKKVKKGSLLFSFKLTVGLTSFAGQDLYTNEAIASFSKNKYIDLNFLKYVLMQDFENNGFQNIYGALLFNIELIKSAKYVIPPNLSEQKLISNFLDKKITLIEKTIKKEKKLIELLEEKKISLINQAVTKGLDPNVKMKDSGIEWIGEIPEHWKIIKINNLFKNIGSGTTPNSSNDDYYNNGICNWLITGDLNDSFIFSTSKKVTELAKKEYNLTMYPTESLVIAMYGATIGKLGILKINTCVNQACCVLSNNKFINIYYAFYWFLSNRENIISLSAGGTQPNINQDIIKNLKIQTPSKEEQLKIVDYLNSNIKVINKTIEKVQKQIDLLEEYKVSLIHNVVTGKIDVRDEVV